MKFINLFTILSILSGTVFSNEMLQFDQMMESLLKKFDLPGATLAISKDGKLVYANAFGYADKEQKIKMTTKTRMRIASVSKPLTATGILKLVESNKIKLDDPIYPYIKNIKVPKGQVERENQKLLTLRHLLSHSAGIESRRGRSPMQPPVSREVSQLFELEHPPKFENVIGYMKAKEFHSLPGKKYNYSNYGYTLIGYIIEKITSKSYEKYMQEELFKPIGITCFEIGNTRKSERLKGEAVYYDIKGAKPRESVFTGEPMGPFHYAYWHHQGWGAAGAWVGSAVDVVKFVNHATCIKSPCLISLKTLNEVTKYNPVTESKKNFWYGLGWRVQKKKDGHHLFHSGSSNVGAHSSMVKTNDNIVWSAHFNQRLNGQPLKAEFNKQMWKIVKNIKSWPTVNLFNEHLNKCD